ncbi:MAG: hypothetical protein IKR19_07480 [Acholeplasmatales bacterium]|nr:hypothetical protein [Acholeplasmatales bacterium]
MDYKIINHIFNRIMLGDSSVLTSDNIRAMNEQAMLLFNIQQLDKDQIDCLKKLLMVCNVLYNRTDMTVLPIEDGFYDLLLEKYKAYDENFQVGSAVIEFRNFIENDLDNPQQIAKPAVIFMDQSQKKDQTHQFIFDKLMRKGEVILNQDDFKANPPLLQSAKITKRLHDTAHNHPDLVGTLDKAKFVLNQDAIDAGVFEDPSVVVLERDFFGKHISDGIIAPMDEIEVIVELKYDGISVEADCTNEVISARTRGDTGIGEAADISPILSHYLFKHADIMRDHKPIGVKFEAIMTKSNLAKFNELRDRSYANCRTAIVGLFGASDAHLFRDLITLVPLAVDRNDVPNVDNRLTEIELMNNLYRSHGEPLRYCYFKGTVSEVLYLIKAFWDEAKVARDYLNFMYDGIVVSYLNENIRQRLGRKNFINKYSMAVKFDALTKQTIFRGYTFEVGQHGGVTPMVHYDPVEFYGTIHTKSSGASFNRFQNLGLRYGDLIQVEYRNDVMPYVSKLECEANRRNTNPIIPFIENCPICGTKLVTTDSGKSVICPNYDCPGRSISRMVNMFAKLNIKGFAEAAFKALNKTHLYELADITEDQAKALLGEADGSHFFYEICKLITEPQKDYIVMGSLGFTSMSHKKWEAILTKIRIRELHELYFKSNQDPVQFQYNMIQLLGLKTGSVTLTTIANEWGFFVKDIDFILTRMVVLDSYGKNTEGRIQVRFTGFRNQQIVEQLVKLGVDADDNASVTKHTNILVIPYAGFLSTKVKKASQIPGIKILTKDELVEHSERLFGTKIIL